MTAAISVLVSVSGSLMARPFLESLLQPPVALDTSVTIRVHNHEGREDAPDEDHQFSLRSCRSPVTLWRCRESRLHARPLSVETSSSGALPRRPTT